MVFGILFSVVFYLVNGKLCVFVVISVMCMVLLFDVFIFVELGFVGYVVLVWYGIFVVGGILVLLV